MVSDIQTEMPSWRRTGGGGEDYRAGQELSGGGVGRKSVSGDELTLGPRRMRKQGTEEKIEWS